MSEAIRCDGCGVIMAPETHDHAITGERTNMLAGGGLPAGRFDWCTGCAGVAFKAVASAGRR